MYGYLCLPALAQFMVPHERFIPMALATPRWGLAQQCHGVSSSYIGHKMGGS